MNKIMLGVVMLVFMFTIVVLGMRGTIWANKLGDVNQVPTANVSVNSGSNSLTYGNQVPGANGLNPVLPAGVRPQGTVNTSNQNVPLTVGQTVTVGSSATVLLKSAPPDLKYIASVVDQNEFSKDYPGNLTSSLIRIDAVPANNKTLGAELQVCFPIAPAQAGFAYYWDGTQWVKTTLATKDSQSCTDIPASAPNPLYTAMFDK